MAKINLLPWREELRKQKQQEFAFMSGGAAIIAALVVLLAHLHVDGMINNQGSRNAFLEKEIDLIAPAVIVPLGYYATKYFMNKYDIALPKIRDEFSSLYGKLFAARDKRLYPLPHPSALLYSRSYKPLALGKCARLRVLL